MMLPSMNPTPSLTFTQFLRPASMVFFPFLSFAVNPQTRDDTTIIEPNAVLIFIQFLRPAGMLFFSFPLLQGYTLLCFFNHFTPVMSFQPLLCFLLLYRLARPRAEERLINIAVRTLGNGQIQHISCHFHHDLRSTTFTEREQRLFSSRVITNASSSKPRTTRHTSNCACHLPKTQTT